MKNKDGAFVSPDSKSFQAAAASADWAKAPGFNLLLTDQAGKDSWPITGATFILIPTQPKNAATAKSVIGFFDWAYTNGDAAASGLDYVPLPEALIKQVRATWKAEIKGIPALSEAAPVSSAKQM